MLALLRRPPGLEARSKARLVRQAQEGSRRWNEAGVGGEQAGPEKGWN